MSHSPRTPQFFASTPGQIIILVRGASRTVEELAEALEVTDNAIRAHLATLQRDGFVQQRGLRRSGSKPAFLYELTEAGEDLFTKSYDLVLRQLLDELNTRIPAEEVEEVLRSTGRRLVAQWPTPRGELYTRLEAAISVLNALGGLAELKRVNGAYVIQGHTCPLATVVPGHPSVCRLVGSMITGLVGVQVEEQCDRTEKVSCRFLVSTT